MCFPLEAPLRFETRLAGVFLFLPLLARVKFNELARVSGYPSSEAIPASAALLSLLMLKLVDKERKSHIDDFNCDKALGLFAGLNIPPKKSFATAYSYRVGRDQQQQLLAGWVQRLAPILLPEARSFSLDFHPIPYRGEQAILENHYVPGKGKASPSVQSFFAMEQENHVFCYANANLIRSEQAGELMRFVEFWRDLTGKDPEWLYFDSKLTTYEELSRVNARNVKFVTIRRRGSRVLARLEQLPARRWVSAVIDIPKRRYNQIQYVDELVRISDYEESIRQIAVRGMGRKSPTLFLTNHLELPAREVVTNYAHRNHIEDGLGTNVDFFHLDCLCSEVRLNVDLDVTLTVLANGCYRWLATRLKGFENAKAKRLFRKFVETGGAVTLTPDNRLQIAFERRCHNPILREGGLDADCPPIPWLNNARLEFTDK